MKQIENCPACGAKNGWIEIHCDTYRKHFSADGDIKHRTKFHTDAGDEKFCAKCELLISWCIKEDK